MRLVCLTTRGEPNDSSAFDDEASGHVLMGTSVKMAMGKQSTLKQTADLAARKLADKTCRCKVQGKPWINLGSLVRHCKYRRFQSNLCKAIQVEKTLTNGLLENAEEYGRTSIL